MEKLVDAITFMIDAAPLEKSSRFGEKLNTAKQIHKLAKTVNYEFSQLHEVCLDFTIRFKSQFVIGCNRTNVKST